MDDGLKQRVVGALVLLALAVIFVPVLFEQERIEPVNTETLIPPSPTIAPPATREIRIPSVEKKAPEASIAFLPNPDEKQELFDEAAGLDENGVPKSWVLQVASFKSNDRAIEFRDRLISDGHKAYLRQLTANQGQLTRVYVGPKINKDRLITEKQKIDKMYSVDSLLLKFDP